MPTSTTGKPRRRVRVHAIYAVAVLAALGFVNLADQTVLGAVLGSIQAEFHLSDAVLGLTAGAFTVSLALGAIPIGYWADRRSRRVVIALGAAAWSLATLATGLTQNLGQLLAARSLVGIGEASGGPATSSLVADYFTSRARGRANAIIAGVGGLGLGGGLILGGVVSLHYGWRAAFYAAAGPGLLLALLALTIREPLRGAAEDVGPRLAAVRDAGWRAARRLLRNRTYVAAVLANALGGFGFSVLSFTPLYLHRTFGLNSQQAAMLAGLPLLAGVVLGVPLTGWLVDWRARRSVRAAVEVGAAGLLVAAAGTVLTFSIPSMALFGVGLVVSLLGQAAAILAPIVILQNVVVPSLRASAASINLTFGRLCGWALGPLAVGLVSDLFGRNLRASLLILIPSAFLLGAACLGLALRSVTRDVASMESDWAAHESQDAVAEPAA